MAFDYCTGCTLYRSDTLELSAPDYVVTGYQTTSRRIRMRYMLLNLLPSRVAPDIELAGRRISGQLFLSDIKYQAGYPVE